MNSFVVRGYVTGSKHFSKEHLLIFTPMAIKANSQKQAREFGAETTINASFLSSHKIRCRTTTVMDGMTIFKKDEGQNEATYKKIKS